MWTKTHESALTDVFNALDESGVRWMVLRNYEGLPSRNRSKDIDLAISKDDLSRAQGIVRRVMLHNGFDRVFSVSFRYAECNVYLSTGDEVVHSLKLDFLYGFEWRGAVIYDFDAMYLRRVPHGSFFVPDRFSDGFMLWVKPLLTGGIVKERYIQDIEECVRDYPEDFQDMLARLFGSRLSEEVWARLEKGNLADILDFQGRLRRAAWTSAFMGAPLFTLGNFSKHILGEIDRRLKRNPGSLLAVVGPDGVGKTTFINLLRKELARVLVQDEDAICVEHFRPHILPNLKQLLSGRHYDPTMEEFDKPHRAEPAGVVSSLFRLTYYWLDYLAGYWMRIRRRCARKYVYIFDRYFYDFLVDPGRSRINLPMWLRKIFLRLTPQPDLVFFLDCDVDTVFSRKQELTYEEIDRQLKVYRGLALAHPQRFIRLDASRPPELSCRQAVRALVERSFECV